MGVYLGVSVTLPEFSEWISSMKYGDMTGHFSLFPCLSNLLFSVLSSYLFKVISCWNLSSSFLSKIFVGEGYVQECPIRYL